MEKLTRKFRNPNTVPLSVLVYIAWRNLLHKKLRAFLTIFGVVVGVGAIFFLLSFGLGLQQLVTNEVIGNQSIKSIDITTPNSKIIKLRDEHLQQIKQLPHVTQAGASYQYAGGLRAQGSEINVIVYGEDQTYLRMENLVLSSGRLLRETDEKALLLNRVALRAIGIDNPGDAIGKKVSLRIPLVDADKDEIVDDFTIVGVVDSEDGNETFISAGVFSAAGVKIYSKIKAEADEVASVDGLRDQIETLGFFTNSAIDTIDQIDQIFRFFNVMMAGFGAVGMFVAVLGMFNTLTISLLERTKEVGLMITLGGRNRDMRILFILEAVILSLAGAIIGIVLAIILGQIINLAMNIFASHRGVAEHFQLFAIPLWLVAGTIAFMLAVGLAVVYLPARRAARINPIDALRRE